MKNTKAPLGAGVFEFFIMCRTVECESAARC
jgi:hypothetical protein